MRPMQPGVGTPFDYQSQKYRFVVVTPRHVGQRLADVTVEPTPCSMLRTTPERAISENPCDTPW